MTGLHLPRAKYLKLTHPEKVKHWKVKHWMRYGYFIQNEGFLYEMVLQPVLQSPESQAFLCAQDSMLSFLNGLHCDRFPA